MCCELEKGVRSQYTCRSPYGAPQPDRECKCGWIFNRTVWQNGIMNVCDAFDSVSGVSPMSQAHSGPNAATDEKKKS